MSSVIVVVVWQLLATWRARMSGLKTSYRKLAEQAAEAEARTATGLEQRQNSAACATSSARSRDAEREEVTTGEPTNPHGRVHAGAEP